ncbi:MAG: DUF4432 family protein [Pirellulaceae bacterium]|nr:DUF4432 family protein [Pirellulaceae bacterium]
MQHLNLLERGQNRAREPQTTNLGNFQVLWEQLHSGLAAGVWRLAIQADDFRVSFLPTRGMSIEDVYIGGFRFGWDSPVPGPVHPAMVPMFAPDGLGWLHGFTELLVRCGLTNNGAPQFNAQGSLELPLHGQIGNLPAQQLRLTLVDDNCLEVEAEVDEVRFHFQKWRLSTCYRIRIGETKIEVVDKVTNLSGRKNDFQMLYHFNLGPPLLETASKLHLTAKTVVPRNELSESDLQFWDTMPRVTPEGSEQVLFMEPKPDANGQAWAVLTNPDWTAGVGVEYNVAELPCLTIWKNPADLRDGYVLGIEPGTNFPNPKRYEAEQGRTVWLEPGASTEIRTTWHFAADMPAVEILCRIVEGIQGAEPPTVHSTPQPKWSR